MATFPTTGQKPYGDLVKAYIDAKVDKGELVLDAVDYGAVGNNAADNASAINSAITAASAFGVGITVLVPKATGAYMLGSVITMKSGVTLRIEGTLKMLASATSAAIRITDVSNVRVCGSGVIDMNKAATTNGGSTNGQQAIYINSSTAVMSDIRVEGVSLKNGWQRGVAVAEGGQAISDIRLRDLTITSFGDRGVSVVQNTGIGFKASGLTITSPGAQGITVTAGTDVRIADSTITSPGDHGLVLGGNDSATSTVTRATVTGVTVSGAAKYGLVVSMRVTEWTITGCVATGCTQGGCTIDVERTNSLTVLQDAPGSVTGCVFAGASIAGALGIQVRYARGVNVVGNTCHDFPAEGIYLTNSVGTVVTANTLLNNGTGVKAAQAAGVTSGDYRVLGNYTAGNTTAYDLSAATTLSRCDFQVPYTPAWTAITTNPTLGDGTLVGEFTQIGEVVDFTIVLTIGSTTTLGSGAYIFTLPVPAATLRSVIPGHLLHSGNQYVIQSNINNAATGTITPFALPTTAGGALVSFTGAVPVALVSGDRVTISGTYIAAS